MRPDVQIPAAAVSRCLRSNRPVPVVRKPIAVVLLAVAFAVFPDTAAAILSPEASPARSRAWQSSEPACDSGVCFEIRESSSGPVVIGENDNFVPVTVRVELVHLENLRNPGEGTITTVIDAGTRRSVTRLRVEDRRRSHNLEIGFAVAYGDPEARHDDTVRYLFPFGGEEPRPLAQGPGGGSTHRGRFRNAFDFDMPAGTPVLAARGGRVLLVRDGFTEGGLDPALRDRSNSVTVAHEDGTFADYGHLSPGIVVEEGERVEAGQLLGYSGATGYAEGPHLHFHVWKQSRHGREETLPIRFADDTPWGVVPVEGGYYGPTPKSDGAGRSGAGR